MVRTEVIEWLKSIKEKYIHGGDDFYDHQRRTAIDYAVCFLEGKKPMTNADRIRAMSDEELSEFLTNINPTNCQDCAFSHGWRCQPDRDDYSDFEKCEEGRKRWLKQPAEGE